MSSGQEAEPTRDSGRDSGREVTWIGLETDSQVKETNVSQHQI